MRLVAASPDDSGGVCWSGTEATPDTAPGILSPELLARSAKSAGKPFRNEENLPVHIGDVSTSAQRH